MRDALVRAAGPALALLLLLATAGRARAVEPLRFERLGIEDGLTTGRINAIAQDGMGFLWVGTSDGLTRYDGVDLVAYRHDPRDPASLPHADVRALHVDEDGVLWIGTRGGGLSRWDPAVDGFRTWRPDADDATTFPSDYVETITTDRQGRVWVGTRDEGLVHLDRSSGRVVRYPWSRKDAGVLADPYVTAIAQDATGAVWVAGRKTPLYHLDVDAKRFVPMEGGPDPTAALPGPVTCLLADGEGGLWIGTTGGLARREPGTGRVTSYPGSPDDPTSLPGQRVQALARAADGRLWVGTDGGLALFDPATGRARRVPSDRNDPHALSSDAVQALAVDRSGIVWVGTDRSLDRHDPATTRFRAFRRGPGEPSGYLESDDLWGVAADHTGAVWVGTGDGGLTRWDAGSGEWRTWRHVEGNPASLVSDTVHGMAEDHQGRIWIAGPAGLHRLDPSRDELTTYRHDPSDPASLASDVAWTVHVDPQGNVWIGGGKGVDVYDPSIDGFRHPCRDEADPDGGMLASTFAVSRSRDGTLWIGTFLNGLYAMDPTAPPNGREWEKLRPDPDDPRSLTSMRIFSLLVDSRDRVWVGTAAGLNLLLDRAGKRFRHFRGIDGLPSETVSALVEDASGAIWVGTQAGLARLDPETGAIRAFRSVDGLPSDEITFHGLARTPDGHIVVGTTRGFAIFDPTSLVDDPTAPLVVIDELTLFNRPVPVTGTRAAAAAAHGAFLLDRSVLATDELTVSHRESVLGFGFAGLHFADPLRNRYAYRLEGWDEDWLETDARRPFATYTNLPGGRYVFRVRASNKDGVWSPVGDALRLRVLPPPWKSWWAYTLYGLLGLAAVGGTGWSLVRRAEEQRRRAEREADINRRLRRADRLKDEFLANTSHELRTPLNGIIGLAESLVDGIAGTLPDAARSNLSLIVASGRRLASLVDDVLDFSKLRNHSLALARRPLDLRSVVDVVLTLQRPLARGKELRLENGVPADVPAVMADENRVQQVLHNLVGNAVKFTDRGHVTVTAERRDAMVAVLVTDTGIGIAREDQERIFESFEQADGATARVYGGTGLGLAVSRQLVALHGGSLWVDSTLGAGSTFGFTLPVADHPADAVTSHSEHNEEETMAAGAGGAPALDEPSAAPRSSPGAGRRILVVDDEPVNRQVLVNHLGLGAYRVEEAPDGFAALEAVERNPPDLVLLDVMMPRLSGYDVCRRIRERFPASDLPVLYLSAKDQVADLVSGFESGANDYLTKPVSKGELLARVATHLELLDVTRNLESKVAERTALLRARNADIEASIDYARRIQASVLPSEAMLRAVLPPHFVLFRPRETVSGDFYWVHRDAAGSLLVAVVDCTGHGVPGAFMSLIGHLLLEQVVVQEGRSDPAEILGRLHDEVRAALHQEQDTASDDGMDLVLCRIEPDGQVLFAGAANPLYRWSGGRVERLRGNPCSIGGRRAGRRELRNRELRLEHGDVLYFATDGFVDHPGLDGRRLGTARFQALLAELGGLDLAQQRDRLARVLDESALQRDDVTVLGLRWPGGRPSHNEG